MDPFLAPFGALQEHGISFYVGVPPAWRSIKPRAMSILTIRRGMVALLKAPRMTTHGPPSISYHQLPHIMRFLRYCCGSSLLADSSGQFHPGFLRQVVHLPPRNQRPQGPSHDQPPSTPTENGAMKASCRRIAPTLGAQTALTISPTMLRFRLRAGHKSSRALSTSKRGLQHSANFEVGVPRALR